MHHFLWTDPLSVVWGSFRSPECCLQGGTITAEVVRGVWLMLQVITIIIYIIRDLCKKWLQHVSFSQQFNYQVNCEFCTIVFFPLDPHCEFSVNNCKNFVLERPRQTMNGCKSFYWGDTLGSVAGSSKCYPPRNHWQMYVQTHSLSSAKDCLVLKSFCWKPLIPCCDCSLSTLSCNSGTQGLLSALDRSILVGLCISEETCRLLLWSTI